MDRLRPERRTAKAAREFLVERVIVVRYSMLPAIRVKGAVSKQQCFF
jgi:hypothetical protein